MKSPTLLLALTLLALPLSAAEPELPPHPSVGKAFALADVDWQSPVFASGFDSAEAVKNWQLEGGKRIAVEHGVLILENTPPGEKRAATDNHLVCWLKQEMPSDFLLEFRLRPQNRKEGLSIIFFNARGHGGKSIFDPALAPRSGLFKQYHSGDLDNYHVSYWSGDRGTANIRKNAGFHLVATGPDLVTGAPADSFQNVRLYKRGGKIRVAVDGVVSVAYDDDGQTFGPIWNHAGWIGLRQMAPTVRCEYDDLRVFPLLP